MNKTKYPKYNIYLLNKNKEEIHKFNVDLGRLSFLGKELRNVSIYYYPIIIFEFMTGYFTTEELFEKNKELSLEFAKDFEIMEKPNPLKIGQSKSGKVEPKDNLINEQKNENQKILQETKTLIINDSININNESEKKNEKESISKSVMITNIPKKNTFQPHKRNMKQIQYSDYIKDFQMLLYLINPQENIKENNPNFGNELEIFNDNLEKYKRKLRIIEMEKEIEFLKRKNEAIKELNKDLEEAIKQKNDNLEKVTNQLKPNKVNYDNKLNQLKNNLNSRGQYQLIYDSFVYQKMAEICFVFFNNKIQSLYSIPPFYNEAFNLNDSKKFERLEYYNKYKKNISAMMGHICQLLIYLSKTFNIPLRYPIFLNGSKSYIFRHVKEKIFLSLFPEIISKTDNENVNNMNGKYLFFFFFVIFNHSLFRFMKTLQNAI